MSGAPMQTVYCVPIDEQGDEIKQDPVIQIPLDNIYSDQESTNNLLRMLLNFGGVAVFFIMVMIGTPVVYKLFISKVVNNSDNKNNKEHETDIHFNEIRKDTKLLILEMITMIMIASSSILLIISGIKNNAIGDNNSPFFGIFTLIALFIAYARMQYEKTIKSAEEFYKEYIDREGDSYKKYAEYDITNLLKTLLYCGSIVMCSQYTKWYVLLTVIGLVLSLTLGILYNLNWGIISFLVSFSYYLPYFFIAYMNDDKSKRGGTETVVA
jgi:hypothetical protein